MSTEAGGSRQARERSRLAPEQVHDLDEVRRAIHALGRTDLARLWTIARSLLGGLEIDRLRRDHRDLLGAAVARTLSGERQWNRQVDLARHLTQVMRSTASHWRRRMIEESKRMVAESWDLDPRYAEPLEPAEPSSPEPDVEAAAITRESITAIRRHFADDPAASEVIACLALGLKGPEIRQRTGLTTRQVQTILQRIRRYARRRGDEDVW